MAVTMPRNLPEIRIFAKQYVAVLSFALLAFIGLGVAFKYTGASFDYYQGRNILSAWQEQENEQTIEQYQLAKAAIEAAVASQPSHPLYQELLAQVYEWGAIAGYQDEAERLSQAKSHYLLAAQLRPLWPVTWASLAMVKWRQQEFDKEMLTYLQRASELGPKKPEVHVLYVQLGMALYASNHPLLLDIRAEFYHRISLGLSNPQSRQKVFSIIAQFEAQQRVCRWLKDEAQSVQRLMPDCPKPSTGSAD